MSGITELRFKEIVKCKLYVFSISSSSTGLQPCLFHLDVLQTMAKKCIKMKYARAKRTQHKEIIVFVR